MHHIQSLKKSVQSETHCCKWFSKSTVISPLWLSLDRSCLQQCQQGQKQNIDCQHKTLKIRWRKRIKCMKPYMPDIPVHRKVGDFSRFRIDSNLAASVCLQPVTCFFLVPCSNLSQLVECFYSRITINVSRIMINVSLAKGRTSFLQSTVHAKSPFRSRGKKTLQYNLN